MPNTPITVSGHVGYTNGFLAFSSLAGDPTDDSAIDWSIGASATVLSNVTLGVTYGGTEGPNINDFSDNKVFASIGVSF